jgi:hypothetical protein
VRNVQEAFTDNDVQLVEVKISLDENTLRFVARQIEDISKHCMFEEICDMFN